MATNISTCKNWALQKEAGVTAGNTDDLESLFLASLGAASDHVNNQWMEVFIAGGATAADWNGAAFEWLGIVNTVGNDLPARWQDY